MSWRKEDIDGPPNSGAFSDSSDKSPMSVTSAEIAGSPDVALAGHEGCALFEFTAKEARELGWDVVPATDNDTNPAHFYVKGKKKTGKKRKIARMGRWRIAPSAASTTETS